VHTVNVTGPRFDRLMIRLAAIMLALAALGAFHVAGIALPGLPFAGG
jgi:hypothetical protein